MCHVRRLIAFLLLLGYAGTGTSVLPALVLAMAEMDGSHEVEVCESEQGTCVLLHHHEDDYTPEVEDHGSALARTLVRMCRPAAEGDHRLSLRHVNGTATRLNDEAEHSLKEVRPLNVQATARFLQARPDLAALERQRPSWTGMRRTCAQHSHRLVATVHLLL